MNVCTIYQFEAPDAPHGRIQVVRLTNDLLDSQDLVIDFPEQWMKDHPKCIGVNWITAANFIDARTE